MSSTVKPTARKDEIVVQEFDNELLIYDLRANKALCLNQTSARIWSKCNGRKSIATIKEELEKETRSVVTDELVWLALDQLKKQNLIEEEKEIPSSFKGLSRREVIRRIGIGSMVALPIITAMIAPLPAFAASGCITVLGGCTCMAGTATGTDCTATAVVACVSPLCRCVDNGTLGGMGGDCVP
jgi:hypothetical protein